MRQEGKPYAVRYDQVNAMLLNEFLKEHRKVEKLEAEMVQQKKRFEGDLAKQQKQIEVLASGLEKVNARFATATPSAGGLEMSGSVQQVAATNIFPRKRRFHNNRLLKN